MNNSNIQKSLGLVSFILLILFASIGLIADFILMFQMIAYGYFSTYILIVCILEISAFSGLISGSTVGIKQLLKNDITYEKSLNMLSVAYFIRAVIGTIIVIVSLIAFQTATWASIVGLIIDLLIIMLLFASFFIKADKNVLAKKTCGITAFSLLAIFSIIEMVGGASNYSATLTVLMDVVLLFFAISAIIYFAMFKGNNEPVNADMAYQPIHEQYVQQQYQEPVHEQPKMNNSEAAEALLKLKQLLDAGVITHSEYEEKRRKYIDQL